MLTHRFVLTGSHHHSLSTGAVRALAHPVGNRHDDCGARSQGFDLFVDPSEVPLVLRCAHLPEFFAWTHLRHLRPLAGCSTEGETARTPRQRRMLGEMRGTRGD